MTDERMTLQALFEKTPDADFLRHMIGFAAQRLMELEVGSLTGVAHGEHSPERLVQRSFGRLRRLPRPRLADPRRQGGVAHPEAAQG